MIRAEWRDYDTAAEMVDAVAEDIGFAIGRALDARGTALIALPGGKSPAPIFERLADAVLDWNRVTIIPTDERVVPADSPLSNVAMIARYFLPQGARLLPIVVGDTKDYRSAGATALASPLVRTTTVMPRGNQASPVRISTNGRKIPARGGRPGHRRPVVRGGQPGEESGGSAWPSARSGQ